RAAAAILPMNGSERSIQRTAAFMTAYASSFSPSDVFLLAERRREHRSSSACCRSQCPSDIEEPLAQVKRLSTRARGLRRALLGAIVNTDAFGLIGGVARDEIPFFGGAAQTRRSTSLAGRLVVRSSGGPQPLRPASAIL